jgi:large subunit ribosomal protein L22
MSGPKTNEREGTRAVLRHFHMSGSKARLVLGLIRGEDVNTAREILAGTTREAAEVIGKLLASAVANAVNNDAMAADELYVSAAFADDGPVMKRFSPRARGRAGRIGKRTTHITIIVSRMDEDRIAIVRAQRSAQAAVSRTRRVASSRRRADQQASLNRREAAAEAAAEAMALEAEQSEMDEGFVLDEDDAEMADTEMANTEMANTETTDAEASDADVADALEGDDETASDDATEETDK